MAGAGREKIREGWRVTFIGMAVNLVLVAVKLMGGYWGHSQALIADAVHSVSDFLTDLVVVFGLKLGGRAPDASHPFGHARLETLASTLVGLALVAAAVGLAYEGIIDIYQHRSTHPTWLPVVAAALSIVSKEILYRYTMAVGRRIRSTAVQANAWHHRSDAISSVAVLIGVGAAVIRPELHILDAVAAVVVSFLVLKVGLDIIWKCLQELTDRAPDPEVLSDIQSCALKVEGVRNIHDLKVRTAGGLYQMELHVVVDPSLSVFEGHRIAKAVERCLLDEVDLSEQITIHVDPDNPEDSGNPD